MKKFFLVLFILFDMALIGAAAFVLYAYITHSVPLPQIPALSKLENLTPGTPAVAPKPVAAIPPKAIGTGVVAPPQSQSSTRKIGFTYHNAHARQVSIRADFTGWKAQPMVKSGQQTHQSDRPHDGQRHSGGSASC